MGTVADAAEADRQGQGDPPAASSTSREAAILAKGFDATSIEEIVAGAEITRSGFFYHFPDKNELARALIERYIEQDRDRCSTTSSRRGRRALATTRCTPS